MDKHRSARRHLRRTDLFVVRVWVEDALDSSGKAEWLGQVHRPVDGESHQFHNWQGLVDVLEMLWEGERESRSDENLR